MTMHSAKGLEFSHVYITGMEDTLFPSPLSTGNPKDLEEERRLFYVAVTRAEKLATLTYADNRYKWGRLEHSHPSRFLRELDQAYVDYPQTGRRGYREPFKISFDREHFSEKKKEYKAGKTDSTPKKNLTAYSEDISSFRPEDPYSFSEGDNIIHERFGKGIIILLDGSPPNTTALVEFEDNGRKKLLLRFARLKKL
jgi:DNA helicase-2/ATP-dependent DNA helicase PcrA